MSPLDSTKPYKLEPLWRRAIVSLCTLVALSVPQYHYYQDVCNKGLEGSDLYWALWWTYITWQPIYFMVHGLDLALLDSTWNNFRTMKKHGVNLWTQVFPWMLTTITLGEGFLLLTMYINAGHAPARFDFTLVWHVLVAVLLSDIPFYFLHQWLHRHAPEIHRLHHLCLTPSAATNLILHPHDLLVEFGLPVATVTIVLSTNVAGMYDPFAAIVAACLQQLWYAMGHDSTLRSHHYYHHKFVNAGYAIYLPMMGKGDEQDKVRALVGITARDGGKKQNQGSARS